MNKKLFTSLLTFWFIPTLFYSQGITILPGAYVTVKSSAYVKTTEAAGFTIQSTASGTGSVIDENGGITVAGTTTVQRYIATDFKWHFLSSPVSGQPIWPEFAPTPTGSNFLDFTWGSTPTWGWDYYYWNPNASATTQLYWVNLRNTDGSYNYRDIDGNGNEGGYGQATPPALSVGRGYLAAYNEGWKSGSPTIHSFTGTLNSGTIDKSIIQGVNSFNLVGNPFPSAIDWKGPGWGRTDLVLSGGGYDYWIFNDDLAVGNYGVCNSADDVGTNGTTRYIAPMQGFFIKVANATGILSMTSAVQVHATQTWLKESNTENNMLRLKLTTEANSYSDEMILKVNPAFVNGGSEKFWSMYQEAPEIYSIKDGLSYSIDRMPEVVENSVVNLGIKAGLSSVYALTVTGLSNFSVATSVTLEDLKTGTSQKLNDNNVYTFNAGPGDPANRLKLHFGGLYGTEDILNPNPVSIYASGNNIIIYSNPATILKGDVRIYDLVGRTIRHLTANDSFIRINMEGNKGYYIVNILTDSKIFNGKVFLK